MAGRVLAPAVTPDVEGSGLAAACLGAGLFAAGFFLAAVFFAAVAPAFFFIFMGRTLQQRPRGGQVTDPTPVRLFASRADGRGAPG